MLRKKFAAAFGALLLATTVLAAPKTANAADPLTVSTSQKTVTVQKGQTFDVAFTYTTPAGSDVRALKAVLAFPDSKLEVTNFQKTDLKEAFDASTPATKKYQYAAGTDGSMAAVGTLTFTFKALGDCTVAADEISMDMTVAIDTAKNQYSGKAATNVTFDHADAAKTTDEKAATCVTDGYKKVICSTCQKELSNEVLKADGKHHWVSTGVIKAATCKEEGEEGFKCDRDPACTATKTEKIAKVAHKWTVTDETDKDGWKVTKEATETEKGEKERVCAVCQEVEKAEIPVVKKPTKDDGKKDNTKKDNTKTDNTKKNNTTAAGTKKTNSKSVKTGDNEQMALYIVMMVLAAVGGFVIYRKKETFR